MTIVKGKGSALRSGWPPHPRSGVLHGWHESCLSGQSTSSLG